MAKSNSITMKRTVIVPPDRFEKGKSYSDVPPNIRKKLDRINARTKIETTSVKPADRKAVSRGAK